jgi:hypothetical protein
MQWRRRFTLFGTALALLVLSSAQLAAAQQSSSSHYAVNEVFFGSGGELQACSSHYCSKQAAGELAIGNMKSSNYQVQGGFNTSDIPILELAVSGGTYDLGTLDAAVTHGAQATFTVRNYLSSGYVVRLAGALPGMTSGANSHTLSAMSTSTTSNVGSEQFGVNLRANTSPSIGADVQQLPDTSFGFGVPATGYGTLNNFKYVDNDVIASSPKSSGTTLYTLAMIANITTSTPAGSYTGHLSVIVVPTF